MKKKKQRGRPPERRTIRDDMAIAVMAGLSAGSAYPNLALDTERIAKMAYALADRAMIERRN